MTDRRTMNTRHRAQQIANEQAADERYGDTVKRLSDRPTPVQGPRNTIWTGSGLPQQISLPDGGLIGRIALDAPDALVGGPSFYIGPRHLQNEDLTVFSWAAPVACTLFGGSSTHRLLEHVTVARSLIRDRRSITDFIDEVRTDNPPAEPFATRELTIPTAPHARPLPRPSSTLPGASTPVGLAKQGEPGPAHPTSGKAPEPPPPTPPAAPSPPRPALEDDHPRPTAGTAPSRPTPPAPPPRNEGTNSALTRQSESEPNRRRPVRAEAALLAAVSAPREDRLRNVLTTLQPDQYDLVTRNPWRGPLVVQGHPGTGKTIVAAHRAAFLVHPDSPEEARVGRVLVVGPTDQYVTHVTGVLGELVHDRTKVHVASITQLLWGVRGIAGKPLAGSAERFEDVDWRLGSLVQDAASLVKSTGRLTQERKPEHAVEWVYEGLRSNSVSGRTVTHDPQWARYLKSLPPYRRAATMGRFHALLAQCAWAVRPVLDARADHVIVDEAQDITPLEWRLLDKLNRRASWSLLGDMNQRRSDWTYHSWDHLGVELGIADDNGALHPERADRGYRTTSAIMAFAGKLLPRSDRAVDSLQTEGPEPLVLRASAGTLATRTAQLTLELAARHRHGTVAVIGLNPVPVTQELRKLGWSPQTQRLQRHEGGSATISVYRPDEARGLEFDAVIVVEPADYPMNLGRHGLLYTSLTRANRELAVVHSKPLPDALRKSGRR